MRILFTSLRNTSHFLPLVPFIDACRRAGHEVAVSAAPDLAERVAKTGAEFRPFGHPGDEGLRPIWARLRDVPREEASQVVIRDIFAGACAKWALPDLLGTVERWKPDVVVRESQEYAAVVAAEKAGIPHARVSITARGMEGMMFSVAGPALDAHRQSVGLPRDEAGEAFSREPALTMFPESLDPYPSTAPLLRFRSARKAPSGLPDHWSGSTAPLAYVTFGTVIGTMADLRSYYRLAVEAVRDLPVRVLFTIGNDIPVEELGAVPPHVRVERFVPQDDVLPHAAAVVCHGGAGTTLGTLAAGVPLVVAPMMADQPDNAERVAACGAGIALPPREATAETLRDALQRVLAEPSFREAARKVAAEMASLPLVDDAPVAIQRLTRPGP